MWFLNHANFKKWFTEDTFGPLLVSADPGCGKSVLAKYLINHILPQSQPATICYFFFKENDQDTVLQALCAVLHQLFCHKPALIMHALRQYEVDGPNLASSTKSLWKVLREATHDSQAGPVIVVLDTLDECVESDFADLVRNIEEQFSTAKHGSCQLKYLLTSRPYNQIVSEFYNLLEQFPSIRIPGEGEEASEEITKEVDYVVAHRISQLSKKKALAPKLKGHLEKLLKEISGTHRTYLWVHLIFDHLEREELKNTESGIASMILALPRSVNEAYERILKKSKDHSTVRNVLSIILAASRPLTLAEMSIAVNTHELDSPKSLHDLDLEYPEDFEKRIRSLCGLFITIHHGRVYFLHQTAREFLISDAATAENPGLRWYHSIPIDHAHAVLGEICVIYLNLFDSRQSISADAEKESAVDDPKSPAPDRRDFLNYAAESWFLHLNQAGTISASTVVSHAVKLCNAGSKSYLVWFDIFRASKMFPGYAKTLTGLFIPAWGGLTSIAQRMVDDGAEVDAKDDRNRTPLWWAAFRGHSAIVKILLRSGAKVNSKDRDGKTPLSLAAIRGHLAVAELLLAGGCDVDSVDDWGKTPLSVAAEHGRLAVAKLLISKGAQIDSKSGLTRRGPLVWTSNILASFVDHQKHSQDISQAMPLRRAVVEGARYLYHLPARKLDAKSLVKRTPLHWATLNGHRPFVELLLSKGADINARDSYLNTALRIAVWTKHRDIMKLLVSNGADVNIMVGSHTLIRWAISDGDEDFVKLMLLNGAKPNVRDWEDGSTPLIAASHLGHIGIAQLLLDKGAKVELSGQLGQTPLQVASIRGHISITQLLLDKGAEVDLSDQDGATPLLMASYFGHVGIVKALLDKGADTRATDRDGSTGLQYASMKGHTEVVKLFLTMGTVDPGLADNHGRTALFHASRSGKLETVEALLSDGRSDPALTDWCGLTSLFTAVANGHLEVVQVLLTQSKRLDSRLYLGHSLLWWARYAYEPRLADLLVEYAERTNSLVHDEAPPDTFSLGFIDDNTWCDACTTTLKPAGAFQPYHYYACKQCHNFHLCDRCFKQAIRCGKPSHTYTYTNFPESDDSSSDSDDSSRRLFKRRLLKLRLLKRRFRKLERIDNET
jgi:ankyrin repeat protein